MVGDDIMAGRALAFGLGLGEFLRRRDQGAEEVGLEHRANPLHDASHALEPHAGVDRWLRELLPPPIGELLELHEHQVPEFEEAVAVLLR